MGYQYDPCDICCDDRDCCTCDIQMSYVDVDLGDPAADGTYTLADQGIVGGKCQWKFENATHRYIVENAYPGEEGSATADVYSLPGPTLLCSATHASTGSNQFPECQNTQGVTLSFTPSGCEVSTTIDFDGWVNCAFTYTRCLFCESRFHEQLPAAINISTAASCPTPPCVFPGGVNAVMNLDCFTSVYRFGSVFGSHFRGNMCIPNSNIIQPTVSHYIKNSLRAVWQYQGATSTDPFAEYSCNLIYSIAGYSTPLTWTPV